MLGLEPIDSLALTLHHAPGACALVIGSGLSRAAGIPTGWEITLDLVRRLAAMKGVNDVPDWAAWYRTEFGSEPNYSEIVDALAATPAERRALLHRYIEPEPDEEARKPTKAHHSIAQLVIDGAVNVIITTNFDRLLENALRERGIEPTIVTDEHSLAGATPLAHARCTIVKVHGDYLDTRIKNTDAELAAYHPDMDRLIDRIFDEYGLLIVGWSGEWDAALRIAFLRCNTRRYPLFWATRSKLAPLAADILAHRQGRQISIANADDFLGRLVDQVQAVRAADRIHPVTLASALALAKRYCRNDDYDAEWAQFLEAEAAKIRAFVSGANWPTAEPNVEGMRALLASIEAHTELMRRTFLYAARWGTAKAVAQLARALNGLIMNAQPVGGYTVWCDLRDLPAAICFYWAIAGFVDGGKLELMREFMHTKVTLNRTKIDAVVRLPLLEFNNNNFWSIISGNNNWRAMVTSQWLTKTLEPELAELEIAPAERGELVEQTEFMIGLEFAFQRAKVQAERGLWAWFPVGTFIHREWFAERLSLLENLPARHPWINAGLLGGTPDGGKLAAALMRETISKG